MSPPFAYRPRARLDLLDQFLYLAEEASVEVAERYVEAVAQTCARLSKQPFSGTPYESGVVRLIGMRRAPVSGFTAHLVFYVPHSRGIDVVRVLHGSRDIESLFAEEEANLSPLCRE